MKPTPIQSFIVAVALLVLPPVEVHAGLIELFEHETRGLVVLSIEGNRLRLTDVAGGTEPMQVFTNRGSGATTAEDMGIAGDWPAQTVLSVALQESPLLPTTRLDSLQDGVGLDTTGNTLNELIVFTSIGFAFALDFDSEEVIGGPVPEPGTLFTSAVALVWLLGRRGGITRLTMGPR